jgi:HlyD family secretion protein
MKRIVLYWVIGIVVVAAGVGTFLWRSQLARPSESEVRSVVVERGAMVVAVAASGSVEPRERVDLAFESPGRIFDVPVEVGDRVEPGDVLARLDEEQLALQVRQVQAALDLATAQLAQLRADARPEEIAAAEADVQAAQARVSAAAANLDQVDSGPDDAQIAAAEAQLASAELQRKVAEIKLDRIEGEGTEKEHAHYDLYAARKAVAASRAELDELLSGPDVDAVRAARANVWAAGAQRDAAQAQLDLLAAGATVEQIGDAEAQVAQAQAALDLAELSLEQAVLRAPFDGVVSMVGVTPGEMASTGPAVTLLDVSQFHLTVSVDEIDVGRLSEGQVAQVTLDALPDALVTGTVEYIAPVATLEGGVVYYDVSIGLASTDVPVRADMTASATIIVEELADVLKIPTWIVRVDRDSGQTYVYREAGGEVERVDVDLGVRYEGFAQVIDGLSEGDEVVWVEEVPFGFGSR